MNKKFLAKAAVSIALSAVLFCVPAGAFMAGRGNRETVLAEETAEKRQKSTSGEPEKKCTCTEECSRNSVNKDCEACSENYQACGYVNPVVRITIGTPSGWHKDSAKVPVSVEDVAKTGNFTIQSVKAKIAQNGSWTDITEDMSVEISENSTVYVLVTDQKGKTYERNRYVKCFDFTKPTLNAAVNDGMLTIQAHDTDSGVKAVYVNGYKFTKLTNGTLTIRLQQFDAGYQYFTISAMDNAGNVSEIYKTANPYYTDPESEDSGEKNPAEQLPVSAQATKPGSATGNVTEHIKTDIWGNTIQQTGNTSGGGETASGGDSESGDEDESGLGREFYTIQTESEKVFYLVIDRDGEEEKVYFLTEVSENDLLNTTSENSETLPQNSAALESAIPTGDKALDNNNTDSVQKEEEGTEMVEDTQAGEEETPGKKDQADEGAGFTYLLMGIAAIIVIAAVYFVKSKKKNENFVDDDEEDDDFEEDYDEDDEEEKDPDEAFFSHAGDSESGENTED